MALDGLATNNILKVIRRAKLARILVNMVDFLSPELTL
jgi:hypothetical protein